MYKFWLSRRERDELNELRRAAVEKEQADRVIQAISSALLSAKGDNSRFWQAWVGYTDVANPDNEPTVRELRAFMEQMSDAEKARVANHIIRGY